MLSTRTVDAAGHPVSGQGLENHLSGVCHITRATPDVDKALSTCARQLGIRNLTQVIPSSSFWHLQTVELVIFVGLAAGITGATFWWIRHRVT